MEEKGRAEKSGEFSRRLRVRKHAYTTHTCMSCGVGVTELRPSMGNFEKTRKYYMYLLPKYTSVTSLRKFLYRRGLVGDN